MRYYKRAAKSAFLSITILSFLSFLSACHHDRFDYQAGQSTKFTQDLTYCEWLARSVAAQYDPAKKALWFYKFGKDETSTQKQHISDYVNHHKQAETQFVTFTALSIYDVAYQHMGINAVISLCLERKGHKDSKANIKIASALP